jgi:hypothetical protein
VRAHASSAVPLILVAWPHATNVTQELAITVDEMNDVKRIAAE